MSTVDIRPKREAVSDEYPLHAHQSNGNKAVHQSAEHILLPDHAAIKHGKARGHQHHQRCRKKDKCGISGIDLAAALCKGRQRHEQQRQAPKSITVRFFKENLPDK